MTEDEIRKKVNAKLWEDNLSFGKVSRLAGVSPPTIANWLYGKHSASLCTALAICDALGLELVLREKTDGKAEQMKTIRRFDDLGRINIPKTMRRQAWKTSDTDGMLMDIIVQDDAIVIKKYKEGEINEHL